MIVLQLSLEAELRFQQPMKNLEEGLSSAFRILQGNISGLETLLDVDKYLTSERATMSLITQVGLSCEFIYTGCCRSYIQV